MKVTTIGLDLAKNVFQGIVTLIEGGRNGLQRCPFRLPRSLSGPSAPAWPADRTGCSCLATRRSACSRARRCHRISVVPHCQSAQLMIMG